VIIDDEIDEEFIPKAILSYLPIYRLHIILILGALVASIVISVKAFSFVNLVCVFCVGYISYLFYPYIKKYHPNWAKRQSEVNRIIWKHVFDYMVSEGVK